MVAGPLPTPAASASAAAAVAAQRGGGLGPRLPPSPRSSRGLQLSAMRRRGRHLPEWSRRHWKAAAALGAQPNGSGGGAGAASPSSSVVARGTTDGHLDAHASSSAEAAAAMAAGPAGVGATPVVGAALTAAEEKRPATRRELYPAIEPFRSGFLEVSDVHSLYWEESGNPSGHPVIFLHGGPGAGTTPANRRFFDPDFYRIVLLDQRGAGKSKPHACLVENTTWHLVDDIEKLRVHLCIDRWQVFGGSWGSTLALTYCETHPEHVSIQAGSLCCCGDPERHLHGAQERIRLILSRGRKLRLPRWYTTGQSGVRITWEQYRDAIPKDEHENFVTAYNKRLMNEGEPDEQVHQKEVEVDWIARVWILLISAMQMAAARAWTGWEMATSYLVPNEDSLKRGEDDHFALAFARIENHYFHNRGFFSSDSYLLDNVNKVQHLPAIIIQGRYDMVCPFITAWELHKAWPEAEFRVVKDAGHSANEPGITAELVAANEELKTLYSLSEAKHCSPAGTFRES
eukprot:SM000027S09669  [mRNA]  locus=s27:653657:657228:- [translate_table: standard]